MSEATEKSKNGLEVETTGETVGEAKWQALRELEQLRPGLDKGRVRFQVVSEGKRGLLGVGYSPARVIASVEDGEAQSPVGDEAAEARELVARIAEALGVHCRVDAAEDEDGVTVVCFGSELGVLIGRHGHTIDAVQYLVNAVAFRRWPERRPVVVDASGYRSRRAATLGALAVRSAQRALASGSPVELEPMSSPERKIVHLRLQDYAGVETTSEGREPSRFVVIRPTSA